MSAHEDTVVEAPVAVPLEVPDERLKNLYRSIQKTTGAVGGYGPGGPVYGEVTMGTFQKVVDFLCKHLDFSPSSSFLDIGSGLGKPNMHVAISPGVQFSFGVELEHLRWQLSLQNLRHTLRTVPGFPDSTVYFVNHDATAFGHFEPFTHIYMFDTGFPPSVLVSIANAFNLSRTAKALVSFTKPRNIISIYGFAVEVVGKIQTRMCGSAEGHTAYIYRSTRDTKGAEKSRGQLQLQLDKNFFPPVKHTFAPPKVLDKRVMEAFARPKKFVNVSVLDPVILKGLQIVKTTDVYTQWVQNTGLIGVPGEDREKRTSRRRAAKKGLPLVKAAA